MNRVYCSVLVFWICFFFQAEDGIRFAQESRGLGDVYKRQLLVLEHVSASRGAEAGQGKVFGTGTLLALGTLFLSLIHI